MAQDNSAAAGAQPSDDGSSSRTISNNLVNYWFRSLGRRSVLIEKVLAKMKSTGKTWARGIGSLIILFHLALLPIYGGLGLSSRDEDNYASIFVYGGSIITFLSYVVLYCADINKLTSSIFERGQGENTGTHWAKAGLMGIVLPIFIFIGLIVLFKKDGQDRTTFGIGIVTFISYLIGNTLLLLKRGENTQSEEHELRGNHPRADNSTADNSLVHNSPAANSSVDNPPAANSPVDNSSVNNSPANNSPQPSIRTFP